MDEELKRYIAENPERWDKYFAEARNAAVLAINGGGSNLFSASSLAEYIFELACEMMEQHRRKISTPAEVIPFPRKSGK